VTARTRARACWTTATLSLTLGVAAIPWGPGLAIPGIAGAIILAWIAAGYRDQHRACLLRHEAARRAALLMPDPAPMPDWERLAEQARYDDAFDKITRPYREDAA
jgi:hypothetical protein